MTHRCGGKKLGSTPDIGRRSLVRGRYREIEPCRCKSYHLYKKILMKNVLVKIVSNAMGDTIAAIPYVSQKQKDTGWNITVDMVPQLIPFLDRSYPNLKMAGRNASGNFDEIIEIDYQFNPSVQGGYAMQLGYENSKYIRPTITMNKGERPIKGEYIVMGIHSTCQAKYWNHPDGKRVQGDSPNWAELCKTFRKMGYTPVVLEKNETFGVSPHYNGMPAKSNKKIDLPLAEAINIVDHAKFYIGLSSGMSWVAHALGKKVAMIANFTEDWNEFDLECEDYIRIVNKEVCHGCWNQSGISCQKFDPGDWYWCPKHANTPRQFECHTSITPEMVIEKIKHWL